MSQNAIELLIKSHPLWHQADPQSVPVTVKTIHTVLGRRLGKWHTILASTNDVYVARRTMDAANASGLFDRLVIAQGRSINNAPAGEWTTVECALPNSTFVTGQSFNTLFTQMQGKAANIDLPFVSQATPVIAEKQSQPVPLATACVLAALNLDAVGLGLICVLASLETLFLLDKRPVDASTMQTINTTRNWVYAILNGLMLLPLILKLVA